MSEYFDCPNCGSEVSIKARSCPDCGSDENTGWSEDTIYDGLDLNEYDESSEKSKNSLFQNKIVLYIVAIVTILVFLWMYVI
ncbi:MAG: hypothetical protein GY777_22645 [Candidatus Brocadiaceae bacterium]|nr:hypothetical protein [Candidatus Brocadiaceae bacterium]